MIGKDPLYFLSEQLVFIDGLEFVAGVPEYQVLRRELSNQIFLEDLSACWTGHQVLKPAVTVRPALNLLLRHLQLTAGLGRVSIYGKRTSKYFQDQLLII